MRPSSRFTLWGYSFVYWPINLNRFLKNLSASLYLPLEYNGQHLEVQYTNSSSNTMLTLCPWPLRPAVTSSLNDFSKDFPHEAIVRRQERRVIGARTKQSVK